MKPPHETARETKLRDKIEAILYSFAGEHGCSTDEAVTAILATAEAELARQTAEADTLRNQLATLQGQTRWQCVCGGTDCEGQRENDALRKRVAELEEWVNDTTTINQRDRAEDAANELASIILGEPIDWPDHDAKWAEAIENAECAVTVRATIAAQARELQEAKFAVAEACGWTRLGYDDDDNPTGRSPDDFKGYITHEPLPDIKTMVDAQARELAEAKEQWRMSSVCRELTAKLEQAERERDELRQALQEIADAYANAEPISAQWASHALAQGGGE